MTTEYDEPQGYCNRPTFVKSNPLNNQSYLDQACILYPEWADILRETHKQLEAIVPGYNISQIKEKFWGLRYYISLPEGTERAVAEQAWAIASHAEATAPAIQ